MRQSILAVAVATVCSLMLLQQPLLGNEVAQQGLDSRPREASISLPAPDPPPVVELKPWATSIEHPTSAHRISLDMWTVRVAIPGNAVASQFFDLKSFPHRQWVSLRSTDGKRLPMDVYRDGYTVMAPMNATGRVFVRWLMVPPTEGAAPDADLAPSDVELKPWIMTLEHPTSGHRLFLDTWRLSVRPPGNSSTSTFYDLSKIPQRQWLVLELDGERLPIAIYLENYKIHGFLNVSGRVWVRWAGVSPRADVRLATGPTRSNLVTSWIQTSSRTLVSTTYRKTYEFRADGTYDFVFAALEGSTYDPWIHESGTFELTGDRLSLTPRSGRSKSFRIEIGKDPYGNRIRLVLFHPDSSQDIYYQQ